MVNNKSLIALSITYIPSSESYVPACYVVAREGI